MNTDFKAVLDELNTVTTDADLILWYHGWEETIRLAFTDADKLRERVKDFEEAQSAMQALGFDGLLTVQADNLALSREITRLKSERPEELTELQFLILVEKFWDRDWNEDCVAVEKFLKRFPHGLIIKNEITGKKK